MTESSSPSSRRRWSPQEKATIVRRHLRDGVPVRNLADEVGVAPSQIHSWVKQVQEGAEQVLFARRRHAQAVFDVIKGRLDAWLEGTLFSLTATLAKPCAIPILAGLA